jgi:hypothetical protein
MLLETASALPPVLTLCQSLDVSSPRPILTAEAVNTRVWQALVEPTLHVSMPLQ